MHWYYNYRECASHTVPDKSWVASIYFAVSVDNGPCSGEANTNTNWVFDDHTVIYDSVAPLSSSTSPVYSDRSVAVTYTASDPSSGIASVSVYRTQGAVPATTDALCGTLTTTSGSVNCATTADGTWRFYSRATDKAGNVEALPAAADDTTFVDTVIPAAPNGTLTAQNYATQAAVNGTIYFNGTMATSFTITATGTDAAPSSGIASNTFSAPAVTTGWTTTTAATVAGNPSARAYTWTAAAGSTSITLKTTDNAALSGPLRTITLTDDSTAPAISITAPATDTQNTLISPAFTFTLSDAGSGVDAATTSWARQWTTLTANVCGSTWTADQSATGFTAGSSPAQNAMVNGRCYKWYVIAHDNVNNIAPTVFSNFIKVDTTLPSAPNGTLTAQTSATQAAVNGTIYFNGNVGSSFTITSDGTDPEPASGIASNTFSAPAVTTGWTTTTAATVAGDPVARAYTWTAAAVATSITLKSTDNASNIGAIRTITLTDDSTAPAISITAPATDTQNTLVSPAFTFTLSDAGSGVDAATTSWTRYWTTLTNNVCGTGWTLDQSGSGFGAVTNSSPAQNAMVNGRCYSWHVNANDNVNNIAPTAYAATIKVDTLPPPTTISTSTPCVSPGGQATFTVGRTDPSPSSGWPTSLNSSTSWWLESFDGPWTGAYRLEPWAGNTNASATFNIGYPAPTVGTQAAYTRVVWTLDNAGNSTDSTVPLAQGRGTGIEVTVDNTAPTSPSLTVPAYAGGLINLSFGATGGGCKGVDQVRISNDGTNWWISSGYLTSYTGWDLTNATYGGSTTQGTRTVYIAFREAGTSNWTQTSQTLTYDTSPPVITWTNPTADVYDTTGSVTPSWTVTDTDSGVGSAGTVHRYYLPTLSANVCSGDPIDEGVQTNGTPTTVYSGRCYYWTFTTPPADNVGNATPINLIPSSKTIKVDTVHPTGDLIFDDVSGVTHSRFINASVTMADAESGPLQVRFSTDGGFSWTAWTAYVVGTPTVTPLTLASGTGTYTVLAQIQDLAGNMTPLGHSTALLNEVIMPTLGAAAKIYDCANLTTLLATNTTGTIYWPVDRDLCLVPTARLVTPGSDGTNTPPLIGTISDPSGNTIAPYTLRAPDPDEMVKAPVIVWPTVGPHPVDNAMLRFTFGRETSSLSTSTPYITVPYDTVVTVVWGDNVRSEQVTVALNLRIVVKNSGTTGTH